MKKLIAFIACSNLVTFGSIYVLEWQFGYLSIHFLSDYAFYTMLVLLGLGTLFSFTGHTVGYSDPSNVAGVTASSLIDNDSAKMTVVNKLENTNLGSRFLIASLVPLVFCVFA